MSIAHNEVRGRTKTMSMTSKRNDSKLQSENTAQSEALPLAESTSLDSPERWITWVLASFSIVLFALCCVILRPFVPVLSWAIAATIITLPVHHWLHARYRNENLAAGLAVAMLTIVLVGPFAFAGHILITEGAQYLQYLNEELRKGSIWENLASASGIGPLFLWIDQTFRTRETLPQIVQHLTEFLPQLFRGSIWTVVQLLLVLFTVFYFYRDRRKVLQVARGLVPLSPQETDEIFKRIEDTIHATVIGRMLMALLQGALGGIIFWMLGIPGPMFWGTVMAVFSMIPLLGSFVVWAPAALFYAVEGDWTRAMVLTTWGLIVIGCIDNLLFPMVVGKRLQFHPLLVFFFVMGGVLVFGAAGIILGPVVLSLTDGMLEIWRRRLRIYRNGASAIS